VRSRSRGSLLRGVALGLGLSANGLVGAADAASYASLPGPSESRPNVLIIVTDDQRADTMSVMLETLRLFGEQGVRYPNGFANTPLCCPARASIFTGQFAHNHGIETNDGPAGLDHGTTVQRYLQDAGYRTGIVGKYFNHWSVEEDPPFFDRWTIPKDKLYEGTTYNVDGEQVFVDRYSTDYVADTSTSLIRDFESSSSAPWFLHVAPVAPHLPVSVAPEYQDAPVEPWQPPPSVTREPDPTITDGVRRMLMSVDDLVADLYQTLEELGEADNTLAFFTSDNGFMWWEHSLWAKNKPYTESLQVPFFARWPGHLPAGTTERSPVGHVDIAPTIMHAAGLSPSGAMDGTSLLESTIRTDMLTEAWGSTDNLSWASLRTDGYQYIERFGDDDETITRREFYRLDDDPWQMVNVLDDQVAAGDPDVDVLHQRLTQARACAGNGDIGGCDVSLTSTSVEIDDAVAQEDADQLTFDVALSRSTPLPVEVPYSTRDGSAVSPGDYGTSSGTLLIPTGQSSGQITVPLVDDSLDEVDETFFLDLGSATNATVIDSTGTATVMDDDPEPSLSVADTNVVEGAGAATFSVSLTSPSGKPISARYSTRNGSAVSPGDYGSSSGTVLIPAGRSGAQIIVPVVGDSLDEVDETFFLDLSSAINATVVDSMGTATVVDDDPQPALRVDDAGVVEGNSGTPRMRFVINLSAKSGQTVAVSYETADGTALARKDYRQTSGVVQINSGKVTTTISVPVVSDTLPEADETFFLILSNAVAADIADGTAVGTIVNDDPT
jgi:arylsulfatase A-like enzyme